MKEKISWRNKVAGKGVFVQIGLEFSTHLARRLIARFPGQPERAHLRPLRPLNEEKRFPELDGHCASLLV
jgi:hypothetical protein